MRFDHKNPFADGSETLFSTADERIAWEIKELENAIIEYERLTRDIDIILNGEGAAEQESLCDIVSQLEHDVRKETTEKDQL